MTDPSPSSAAAVDEPDGAACAPPPPPAIAIEGLRVRRGGRCVIHDLSFTIGRGRVVGLFGPSGCGKSTLIRSLVGVQRGVTGSARVLGRPAGAADVRGRIGYVPQGSSVYMDLSVSENLAYFAALANAKPGSVAAALDAVALSELSRRPVRALSGGQQARVSLAAALVGDATLLILDEPTVGLDPLLRRELWALFRRLCADGRTLLISSHVMDEARNCDTLLLLRDGRLIWNDSPAALAAATQTDDLDAAFVRIVERGPRREDT